MNFKSILERLLTYWPLSQVLFICCHTRLYGMGTYICNSWLDLYHRSFISCNTTKSRNKISEKAYERTVLGSGYIKIWHTAHSLWRRQIYHRTPHYYRHSQNARNIEERALICSWWSLTTWQRERTWKG